MDIPRNAYFKGSIVPYGEAKIGVATHALNYGTSVFGGLRGYWNEERKRLFVFRPEDHFKRLLNSAKMMCMEIDHTPASLTALTLALLKKDGWESDVYIRPLIFKADEGIGVRLHDLRDELTIFALPFKQYVKNDTNAHVTVSSWRRLDDNSIPARGKISGAYASSALVKTDAARAGFDEALVMDASGHVAEGSAMNIFMVRDGVVVTPPVTDNILEGITRRSVIELLHNEMGMTVLERSIDRSELFICEEFFMTGTAAQVTVVTKIDHRPVGDGKMGAVASKLRELFESVVRAHQPKYSAWNTPVE